MDIIITSVLTSILTISSLRILAKRDANKRDKLSKETVNMLREEREKLNKGLNRMAVRTQEMVSEIVTRTPAS